MEKQSGEQRSGTVPIDQALALVERALDQASPDRSTLAPAARLRVAELARRLSGRLGALADVLLAEVDRAKAAERAAGTPTSSWLAIGGNLSKRESASALHRANQLAEHPRVADAATAGQIGGGQARAITKVLDALAPQLDDHQQGQAEQVLIDLAANLDADQLAKSAPAVLKTVAPQRADELLETRLQREAEAAQRSRSLRFFRDAGSVRFDGSLPRIEGEALITLIDAYAESQRRTVIEERDPLAPPLLPEQRRADALIALIHAHQRGKQAPSSGGDRPRVIVKLDFDALRRDAAAAGLIGDDEAISAGELRRICCDADLLPAVLGSTSQLLDVGRDQRLVSPAIRAALTLRDSGCAFPSCHTRAAVCEAHHIVPWWAGGSTSLPNLVLLCHHHHGLVEPAKYGIRDQWEVRIAADGVPEFLPPARQDNQRRPLRHQRFQRRFEQSRTGPPSAA